MTSAIYPSFYLRPIFVLIVPPDYSRQITRGQLPMVEHARGRFYRVEVWCCEDGSWSIIAGNEYPGSDDLEATKALYERWVSLVLDLHSRNPGTVPPDFNQQLYFGTGA